MADEARSGGRKELREDRRVEALVPDPAQGPPNATVLRGYLGRGTSEGVWRLYVTPVLDEYVELPETDILHSEQLPDDRGTLVWVPKTLELHWVRPDAQRVQAEFLGGSIAARAVARGRPGLPGGPAQPGPQTFPPVCPSGFVPCPTEDTFRCPAPTTPLAGCAVATTPAAGCPPRTSPGAGCPVPTPPVSVFWACQSSGLIRCPTGTFKCPTNVVRCQSGIVACPSAVDACPTRFCPPSEVSICQSAIDACPTGLCPPSQVTVCPSAVDACPTGFCAPSRTTPCPTPSAFDACPSGFCTDPTDPGF